MNALRGFLGTARWVAPQSLAAVALVGTAALLEGIALLALTPIFQQQVPGGVAGLTVKIADALAIPRDRLAVFGLGLFVLLALGSAAARLAADASLLWIRTKVEELARRTMTAALMRVRWEVYPELKMGEIGKSVYQEGWYIGVGTQVTLQAAGLCAALLIYLAVALAVAPALVALAVLLGTVIGLLVRSLARRSSAHTQRFMQLNSELGIRVQDIFGNLKFFRASGLVASARQDAKNLYRDFAQSYFRAYVLGPVNRAVLEAAAIFFIAFLLYVGTVLAHVDFGSLLVFLALMLRASPRLLTCQDLLFQAGTYEGWHRAWKERLEFAEAHTEPDSGKAAPRFHHSLRFVDVRYQYPAREQTVLDEVSFTLGARELVGIVGDSGSGKSTLLDLVTGVLRPTGGRVEVDGVDLRHLTLQAWRSQIGLVLQETPLFYGSVFDNVAWGSEQRDEARALECLHRAHARPILEKLPRGLLAEVGERGAQLSGGERQRVALARALYREPALLILDEATSALDGASEQEILRAVADLKGSCAILMVAHRLSAVRDADRILVLDRGRIVEEGSWNELVARPAGRLRAMAVNQGLLGAPAAVGGAA